MYLRRVWDNGCCRYVIRESYRDGDCWQCRDLFHLGEDPRACIIYPGGNGFYFSEELEDSLQEKGVDYTSRDLEELFFPFLPPHIRRVLTNFGHCGTSGRRRCSLSTEEELRAQQELHSFDKRRIHFLRCGRVDIGRLEGRNWPFLNILLEKSRDEIEHIFDEMERRLRLRKSEAIFTRRFKSKHILREIFSSTIRPRLIRKKLTSFYSKRFAV